MSLKMPFISSSLEYMVHQAKPSEIRSETWVVLFTKWLDSPRAFDTPVPAPGPVHVQTVTTKITIKWESVGEIRVPTLFREV